MFTMLLLKLQIVQKNQTCELLCAKYCCSYYNFCIFCRPNGKEKKDEKDGKKDKTKPASVLELVIFSAIFSYM